jgi:tetratricopeptide (TPR) repeat protein
MYNEKFYAWDMGDLGDNLIFEAEEKHRNYPTNQYIIDIVENTINLYGLNGSKIKSVQIPYKSNVWDIFPSFNYILIHNLNNPDSLATIIDWKSNIISKLKGIDYKYFTTAISKNDSLILSTIGTQRLYFGLWNLNGKQKKTFIGHNVPISRLYISSDNKMLISGDQLGNVILWDTSGKQLNNFKGHSNPISSLDISVDGSLILTGSYDGTAKLWNTKGQLLYTFQSPEKHNYVPIYARFSSDNNSFCVTDSKNLRFFNKQGVLLQTFINSSNANRVSISDDKKFLYFPDNLGIRKVRLKEPLDTFLSSDKFADLTIAEKLDHKYIQYGDLLTSSDPDQLLSGARYFQNKSMIVTDLKEKNDFLNKAELLYRTLCKLDTIDIRYPVGLTDLLLDKASSTGENVKSEIDKIYETLYKQKNYENLFGAGNYYEGYLNSSTTYYEFAKKAITIFNKIISLYPEKKKALDSPVGSLAWLLVYLKQFEDALDACLLAKRINPEGFYANINLPPCYLLVDSVEKAKRLYSELKDRPVPQSEVQNNEKIFGDVFKSDLKDLKYRGFQIKEYDEILKLLGADSTKSK